MNLRVHPSILILALMCHGLMGEDFSRNAVNVMVTTQGYDLFSPWKQRDAKRKLLTGCVIGGDQILTISQPLADHVVVEVARYGEERRYPAEVLLKDYACGLALLTVKDKGFFAGMEPVTLAESGVPEGKVLVARWDSFGTFKKYAAEVFKTAIGFYKSGGVVLCHHMTTGLDSGGNGEPVFSGGKLVGIVSYFDESHRAIEVYSVDTIRKFLQDFEDGSYQGIPFFSLDHVYLGSDENLRGYLGLGPGDTGVLVNGVPSRTSGHDVLRKGDVILTVDGFRIDDRGLYDAGVYGKLNYCGLICLRHSVGDRIAMGIMRDKKRMDVSFELMPITNDCFFIPMLDYDLPPQYLVYGGLVLQEMTDEYLRLWGTDWRKKVNRRLLFVYDNLRLMPTPERRRCVILNRVLPAAVNVGYHDKTSLILLRLNGTTVRDLRHVRDLIEGRKDRFVKLDFEGGESIVLDRDLVARSSESLLKIYNIVTPARIDG